MPNSPEPTFPSLLALYDLLFEKYGPQGWWPLLRLQPQGENPTKRGTFTGYHSNNYILPDTDDGVFEIMLGAILTQNTSWVNAEKALKSLSDINCLTPEALKQIPQLNLAEGIRSSGYYNQKAIKIKNLVAFLEDYSIVDLIAMPIPQARELLLEVKGVGPETADSMLLYALKRRIFVIDAYTKRLLSRLGIVPVKSKYEFLQDLFHDSLTAPYNTLEIFNEYHALIVQHCVHVCTSKPKCELCFLNESCSKIIPIKPRKKTKKGKKRSSKKKTTPKKTTKKKIL